MGAACESPLDVGDFPQGGFSGDPFMFVNPSDTSIAWGETIQLTATYYGMTEGPRSDLPFTWTSAHPDVVTVDGEGRVTGVGSGFADITASYQGVEGLTSVGVVLGGREWPGEMQLAQLDVGTGYACGLEEDGSLHCWGANRMGQLGLGESSRGTMVPVEATDAPVLAQIAAGDEHTCGLTDSGRAYCWGANKYGAVGDASTLTRNTPTPVSGDLILATVAPGRNHTCAVDVEGRGYCWGLNSKGQLGAGHLNRRSSPLPVVGDLTFRTIATGPFATCGLTVGGAAYCWGRLPGERYEEAPHPAPEPAATELRFAALDVGNGWACGIDADGGLWCWGRNPVGMGSWAQPQPLDADRPLRPETLSMHGEGSHGCALDPVGAAWCWGYNADGQLGDGGTGDASSPVRVAGGLLFQSIAAGYDATCALSVEGDAYCWGRNDDGGLGTGDVQSSKEPRRVVGQP